MTRVLCNTRQRIIAAAALVLVGAVVACSGAPGENVGQTSAAITFANDQPAFDYFLGKGLTSFQAAGIVGNLDQESGVDPTAVESGGPGRGIAQWSVGGRWDTDTNDNATWYASMEGQSVDSLQLQLDFIWYELMTFPDYGLAALQATTNITDATVTFETDFEGCGTCDQSQRIAYAENVLSAFGSDAVDGGVKSDAGGAGTDGGAPCTVTTTGATGVCIETSACAALGGHVSTPGYCPGPTDEQCCTAVDAGISDDAGTTAAHDSGTDVSTTGSDAATTGNAIDAATPVASADGSVGVGATGNSSADGGADGGFGGGSGGCSTSPVGSSGGVWLAAIGWVAARRRRR